MTKPKTDRVKYTLEFKLEAVRLVDTGLTLAAAARSLVEGFRLALQGLPAVLPVQLQT